MRIIEAISDTNIGGAGILLISRLENAPEEKKKTTTVLLPEGSALCERIKELGVSVIETQTHGDRSFSVRDIKTLINILNKIRPTIINTHGFLSARIAAKICHVPVKICTRHCFFDIPKKYNIKAIKYIEGHLNTNLTDHFIAVAHTVKKDLICRGIEPQKISVIVNGSNSLKKLDEQEKNKVKASLGLPASSFVVGIFARIESYKGHDTFIKAAKILCQDHPDIRFIVVGEGSNEKKIRQLVSELALNDKIIFTGFVKDITPYMNIVDVNVNCSRGTETSSLALSEGMSIGKPSVASDFGGNTYMIRHGINGLIYKTNSYRDLAKKIECLYVDKKLLKKLSNGAVNRYQTELNSKLSSEKTYRLYDRLTKKRS